MSEKKLTVEYKDIKFYVTCPICQRSIGVTKGLRVKYHKRYSNKYKSLVGCEMSSMKIKK